MIAPTHVRLRGGVFAAFMLLLLHCSAIAETVAIIPVKDNTLFGDEGGFVSSGKGDSVFAGRVGANGGGWIVRALMKFDLAGAIPPGSTITAVNLKMFLVATSSSSQTLTVHRVLADWGEGNSEGFGGNGDNAQPGDATWLHRFYPNVLWNAPGGDYAAATISTASVGSSLTTYTWNSTPAFVAEIQNWVNNPVQNMGLMVRGNESVIKTVKKLASREYGTASKRPLLTITYTPPAPPECPADVAPGPGNGTVDVDDLLKVINKWGAQGDNVEDITENGLVDVDDLLSVINSWGPCL